MAKIKAGLLSLRDLFATAWWIFLIVGIGFVVAYQFVQPAPPKRIVITTGGEAGAYYQFAQRYAAILARDGITLEVKSSAGSLENLDRLKADQAQVGFVQGGVMPPKEDPDAEDDSGHAGDGDHNRLPLSDQFVLVQHGAEVGHHDHDEESRQIRSDAAELQDVLREDRPVTDDEQRGGDENRGNHRFRLDRNKIPQGECQQHQHERFRGAELDLAEIAFVDRKVANRADDQ